MDRLTSSIVDRTVRRSRRYPFEVWEPGEKLKILLVGYNGKRNTGADVRVAAMVDQFYHILGKDNVEIGILTLSIKDSEVYFHPPTKLIPLDPIFFNDVLKACSSHHLAVISEGSTLKSKFANSLTLFFVEACGIMKQQNKPCIAYGSEASDMDGFVYDIAKRLCDLTYFIARTEQSMKIIQEMGLRGEVGTDTGWTFQSAPKEWAYRELKEKAGWDGKKEIIGVAAINPFCWPVKPSLARWLKMKVVRSEKNYHYDKWYFFSSSEERTRLFKNYLRGIATAVEKFISKHHTHVVIFGMEALDYEAATTLQAMMGAYPNGWSPVVFSSRDYNGYQITALLRALSMLITSRYHARVLSMPGGVPSIAVSMDERLYNLLQESGHLEDYYFEVDDQNLGEKLGAAMEKMWRNREKVAEEILRTIPGYLKKMASMGATFRNFIKENFPQFPLPPEPESWGGYLASLNTELE